VVAGRDLRRALVHIALPDFSFLVVLKEVDQVVFLKTAYPIERASKRDAVRREYEAAEKR